MTDTKEILERRTFKIKLIKRIIKKFLYIFLIVCLYNAFLITKSALDDTASKEFFGYKAYIITTDSMKPRIREGDAVIVEKVKEEKLIVGDIVTIKTDGEGAITHRIVAIMDEGTDTREYVTKGDNNNIEDPEFISYDEIEGKLVLTIPLFGKVLLSLKTKVYIIIAAIGIILIVLRIIGIQKRRRVRREKKRDEDNKNREGINFKNHS